MRGAKPRRGSLLYKLVVAVAALAAGVLSVPAQETLTLGTNVVWEAQKVAKALEAPNDGAAAWKKVGWDRVDGKKEEAGGTWKRTKVAIPADWKDRFVRLEFGPLQRVDAVVFVNGEKVGEVARIG